MKRTRSTKDNGQLAQLPAYFAEFHTAPQQDVEVDNGLLTPPPEDRPSKILRHGSRWLSALRSLTNSAASREFPYHP